MKSYTCVLALAAGVISAAIPSCDSTDIAQTKVLLETPTLAFQEYMGNLSYLFGWTLAGSALSQDELDVGCDNIANIGHGKWAAQGLVPAYIQEPVCNQSTINPNATLALPWELYYSTEIFITQMLSSFASNNTAAYANLCNNLRFKSLDGFHLSDARVINASCTKANTLQPPRPFTSVPGVSLYTNATVAYWNTISVLYGLVYASSATSTGQLNVYCAHGSDYVSSYNTQLLNGTLVVETICSVKAPMTLDQSIASLRTWASRAFATVIENISNVDGWLTWLSQNLDITAMDAVGLDGAAVLTQVTQDATSSA